MALRPEPAAMRADHLGALSAVLEIGRLWRLWHSARIVRLNQHRQPDDDRRGGQDQQRGWMAPHRPVLLHGARSRNARKQAATRWLRVRSSCGHSCDGFQQGGRRANCTQSLCLELPSQVGPNAPTTKVGVNLGVTFSLQLGLYIFQAGALSSELKGSLNDARSLRHPRDCRGHSERLR